MVDLANKPIWLALWCGLLGSPAWAEPLQDPTAPLPGTEQGAVVKQVEAALPKLQSIMLGSGPALAVINGRSYRIGQQVDGYQLVSIGADSVVLERAGKRQALSLFGGKIKM